MPLPRGVDLMTDQTRALLLPGERPLAYELATQLAGHSGIGGDASPRAGVHFSPDPFVGGVQVNDGWLDAKVGGVNAAGGHGSLADQFSQALGRPTMAYVLLTDRRVMVVGDEGGFRTTPPRIHFAVERRAVARLERAPRLLQRGRVRITFADGSWAMAMLGLLKAAAARRLLAATGQR